MWENLSVPISEIAPILGTSYHYVQKMAATLRLPQYEGKRYVKRKYVAPRNFKEERRNASRIRVQTTRNEAPFATRSKIFSLAPREMEWLRIND